MVFQVIKITVKKKIAGVVSYAGGLTGGVEVYGFGKEGTDINTPIH